MGNKKRKLLAVQITIELAVFWGIRRETPFTANSLRMGYLIGSRDNIQSGAFFKCVDPKPKRSFGLDFFFCRELRLLDFNYVSLSI